MEMSFNETFPAVVATTATAFADGGNLSSVGGGAEERGVAHEEGAIWVANAKFAIEGVAQFIVGVFGLVGEWLTTLHPAMFLSLCNAYMLWNEGLYRVERSHE